MAKKEENLVLDPSRESDRLVEENRELLMNKEQIAKVDEDNVEYGFNEFFQHAYKLIINNMLIQILSNIHLFTMLSFLNNKYNSDKYIINSFGAVNSILNVAVYPIVWGFIASIELKGSLAHGANNLKQFGDIVHRSRIVGNVAIISFMSILMIVHKHLFAVMKYDDKQSDYMFKILILRVFSIPFEFEFNAMFRVILIIGKECQGIAILAFQAGMMILYSFLIITYSNLGIYAVGLVYILSNLTSCILVWSYILIFKHVDPEILKYREGTLSSEKFWEYLKLGLILCSLSLLDSMDNETMSIMASFLDQTSFSAYNIIYSINIITSCVSLSFYVTTNIMISHAVGEGLPKKVKTYFKYMIYTGVTVAVFVIIVLSFLRDQIIGVITNSKSIVNIAVILYPFILVTILLETLSNILRNSLKSLGKLILCLIITAIVVILNGVFIWAFTFGLNLAVPGVYYGYITYLALSIISYAFALLSLDWKTMITDAALSAKEEKKDHVL